uniref:Uncharacterized protein n=1 Tax=Hucho hucho TaxID=62062 RepID=A0A4W5N6Z8_9TELE
MNKLMPTSLFPQFIFMLMLMLISFVSTVFCGHLGKMESATPSIFGSNNLKYVGVLLSCFPCWALLINTEPILQAVHQSPEVSRSAPPSHTMSHPIPGLCSKYWLNLECSFKNIYFLFRRT